MLNKRLEFFNVRVGTALYNNAADFILIFILDPESSTKNLSILTQKFVSQILECFYYIQALLNCLL